MPFTFKLSKRLALMKAALVPAAAAALAACQLQDRRGITDPTLPSNSVVQVVIVPDTVMLEPSQTQQFRAYGRTEAGDSGAITMTWSATDGAISSDGLYTASPFAGDYQVTAALVGAPQAGHSVVHVRSTPVLAQVVVVPRSTALGTGASRRFSAYGRLSSDDSVPVSVTWSATGGGISSSGLYTAGLAPGGYVVTASAGGITGTALLTITDVSVASVAVSPASASMSIGSTRQLSAVVRDANGNVLTGRAVTWATDSSAVATVSSGGLVTAAAVGSATITATSEGKSGAATVTVANLPVASVAVSPAAPSVYVGGTVQLTAIPKDPNGNLLNDRPLTWASSNSAVAGVSASGLVTGVAAGSATITATSEGKSGTATVTIVGMSNHLGSPDLEPGLLGRTDLVLFEDFEYADWLNHWSGGYMVDQTYVSRTTSPLFQGSQGLQVRVPNGGHYGVELDFAFAKKGLAEPDQIYLRYYVRFNDTWQKNGDGEIGKLPGFGGTYGRCGWSSGPVDGTCWSARMMNWDTGTGNQIGFYVYHMDGDGQYGSPFRWQPALTRGEWHCVEAQVKLNSLSGGTANYDGVLRGWIDGAPAFERTNLRFRNVSSTHIEKIWWNIYVGGQWTADRNMAINFDNVVVAQQRIGCYSAPTP
jgi:Big-like domain-containing protein/polysaccharide lyase-like protein